MVLARYVLLSYLYHVYLHTYIIYIYIVFIMCITFNMLENVRLVSLFKGEQGLKGSESSCFTADEVVFQVPPLLTCSQGHRTCRAQRLVSSYFKQDNPALKPFLNAFLNDFEGKVILVNRLHRLTWSPKGLGCRGRRGLFSIGLEPIVQLLGLGGRLNCKSSFWSMCAESEALRAPHLHRAGPRLF